jgi:hypothetical protein
MSIYLAARRLLQRQKSPLRNDLETIVGKNLGGCNPNSEHWSCQRISTDTSEEGHHISLALAPDPVNGLETAHIVSYSTVNEQTNQLS